MNHCRARARWKVRAWKHFLLGVSSGSEGDLAEAGLKASIARTPVDYKDEWSSREGPARAVRNC